MLAPNALLKLTGGNSNGTIIVDSYFGSSEFHWSSFDGDLTFVAQTPTPTSTPIPTPTSTPIPTPTSTPIPTPTSTPIPTPTSTPIPTPTSTPIPTPTSTPIPTPTSTPIPTPTSTPIPTPTSTPIPTPTSTPIPTPTSTPIPTPTPVNKVPSAVDDAFTTDKGNAITTTSVLENDDLGDEPTIVSAFDETSFQGGTVVYNEDGTFTYTPASGFSGTDTFTYTIEDADGETATATVTIRVNAIPSAEDDTFTTIEGNTITTTSVFENDDLGDELTIVSAFDETSFQGGTVLYNADGTFTYTPASGFSGTDTFTYTIRDKDGETATATVTITVTENLLPIASDDSFEAQAGVIFTTTSVLANDTMGNADTIVYTYDQTSTQSGTVWHVGNGIFEYTSIVDFSGTDTFTYTLIDGNGDTSTATVTIRVNAIPSAEDDDFTTDQDTEVTTTSVLENDDLGDEPTIVSAFDETSFQGGTVVYNEDGTFTYTPASGFSGTDTFTYTIEDADGETSTATVTITVTAAPT
ncbi:MAG: tandem-95 repeat protein, partial [Clostridiaceae bacterium]|nr:tandem-95 repeat protein [Clostridiaceae bacterium]